MKFKKPKKFDYNVVVIGAGSAGLVSSYIASALKAKVALIEKHQMGGDCLNTGCVPSKALIRSAKVLHQSRKAKAYGFKTAQIDYEFSEVMERIQKVIQKIEPHDSVERYTNLGVECIQGSAKILSPYEVQVADRILTTRTIIVATGARPLIPNIQGLDKIKALTSDNVWQLRVRPKKLIVLGGGPIGCELAQAFSRLDCEVSLVEMASHLMPREDLDVSEFVEAQFREEKIQVLTGTEAKAVEVEGEKKFLNILQNGQSKRIEFDELLIAVGRKANVTGFGLEELGVKLNQNGTIAANEFLATNIPNIFVCGDVTGPFQFTHMAAHQAYYTSVNSLFYPISRFIPWPLNKNFKVNYSIVPYCTYTDPEVAGVGLNEAQAQKMGLSFDVTRYEIDDLDRAIADEEDRGFVKVLTQTGTDKILGATIVGSHAGELITEFISAIKHGYGLNSILGTIHIYPTMSEANKYAAGVWKRSKKPEGALRMLSRFFAFLRG